jgi:Tfp pilus assembly protein PilF
MTLHRANPVSKKTRQLFDEGLKLHRLGRLDEAMLAYDKALKLAPKHFDTLHHVGIVAFQKKNYALSLAFLRLALTVDAGVAAVHSNLGNTLKEMQRFDEALHHYDRAIAFNGGNADTYFNRGAALHAADRPDEALESYDKAIALNDKDEQAWHSRAVVLGDLARYGPAMDSVLRSLALNPRYVEAHWGKALLDLLLGHYTEGWRGYEARWAMKSLRVYDGDRPAGAAWLGAQSLSGKTILLYAEQGLGDTLQFCRYVPLVAQRGAKVVLEAPPSLLGLLATLGGVSELRAKGDVLPAYDYHCALMSLPHALNTQLDTIPDQVPYLSSDPAKVAQWSTRLGKRTRPRVGVVWSGNSRHGNDGKRSIALAEFARLFSDRHEFVVLQNALSAPDRAALALQPAVRQFSESILDFTDTAALCELMDLVVTVDTSVAHLAGALGRPTLVLLASRPDWRWLLERSDSPWYRTARLCRQTRRGDWTSVLDQVIDRLARLPATRHAAEHACPVCGTATAMHDVVDFNKSCAEAQARHLPLSGQPIYYHRCPGCAFAFAPEFRQWPQQAFRDHIYNDGHADVDPDGASVRPLANATFLHALFGDSRGAIRHLDYGGDGTLLSATLREHQWNSTSHDPLQPGERCIEALGKFDLITAFAAFERSADVAGLMRELRVLMADECIVIFSTLFSDGHIEPHRRLTWWYASPRNGHISLFSKQSLVLLAQQNGLEFGSFNETTHCLFGRLPAWAQKLTNERTP